MQSPLPLRSFEHSGPMTFYACPHVLVVLPCTACAWWEQVHVYKCNAATCVDVYHAALMRRGTPKHACLYMHVCIIVQNTSKTYHYSLFHPEGITCISVMQLHVWMCTKLHWWGVERRNMHVCRLYYIYIYNIYIYISIKRGRLIRERSSRTKQSHQKNIYIARSGNTNKVIILCLL